MMVATRKSTLQRQDLLHVDECRLTLDNGPHQTFGQPAALGVMQVRAQDKQKKLGCIGHQHRMQQHGNVGTSSRHAGSDNSSTMAASISASTAHSSSFASMGGSVAC
jgi:hypothetical protein